MGRWSTHASAPEDDVDLAEPQALERAVPTPPP